MATTTPNYGWPVPTSTDYVKDGATAIEALGDAIDATVFGLGSAGLTLVKTQTIGSAVSSVTVTGAFSATYDAYKIIISGGASSSNTCVLQMTLGSTATGYRAAIWEVNYTAGSAVTGQNNTAFWNFGLGVPEGLSAIGDISLPFASDQTTFSSTAVAMGLAGGNMLTRWMNGFLGDTTSYTAFTITPSAGTLTGGTIKVYGYKA
jgi:hypothetical protein